MIYFSVTPGKIGRLSKNKVAWYLSTAIKRSTENKGLSKCFVQRHTVVSRLYTNIVFSVLPFGKFNNGQGDVSSLSHSSAFHFSFIHLHEALFPRQALVNPEPIDRNNGCQTNNTFVGSIGGYHVHKDSHLGPTLHSQSSDVSSGGGKKWEEVQLRGDMQYPTQTVTRAQDQTRTPMLWRTTHGLLLGLETLPATTLIRIGFWGIRRHVNTKIGLDIFRVITGNLRCD